MHKWIQHAENLETLRLYKLSHSNMQIQQFLPKFWIKTKQKKCQKKTKNKTFRLLFNFIYLNLECGTQAIYSLTCIKHMVLLILFI